MRYFRKFVPSYSTYTMQINIGKSYKLWIALAAAALIPLLLLNLFNLPCNDDFVYALRERESNAVSSGIDTYLNFSGRYFATLLSRVNPLIDGYSTEAYRWLSLSIQLLFAAACAAFAAIRFRRSLDTKEKAGLGCFLLVTYIVLCPSVSQSFYWFSAYITYTVPSILLLLLLATLKAKQRPLKTAAQALLAVAITGSNEISAVILFCVLLFVNLEYRKHAKRLDPHFVALLIVSAVATLAVAFCPGNESRMVSANSKNLLWTLGGSLAQTASWFILWGSVLLMLSIAYIPLFGKKLYERCGSSPVFSVSIRRFSLFFVITVFLSHIPPTWGLGTVMIGRLANALLVFFILAWLFLTQLIVNKYPDILKTFDSRPAKFIYAAFLFFLTVNVAFAPEGNMSTAYTDLVSGKAAEYNREMNERIATVRNRTDKEKLVLPAFQSTPLTIFFKDLSVDKDSYENDAFRIYWNCASPISVDRESVPQPSNFEQLKAGMKKLRSEMNQ